MRRPAALLILLTLSASACVSPIVGEVGRDEAAPKLARVEAHPPLWDEGSIDSLKEALDRHLEWLGGLPADSTFDYGIARVDVAVLRPRLASMREFLNEHPSPQELARWIDERFDAAAIEQGEVLVTGYFEPVIEGAPNRTREASIPVYRRPDDLVEVRLPRLRATLPDERVAGRVEAGRLIPYFSRKEIQEEGALIGRGLEIAWVNDRVDLFFLEIQGSGAIRFPDGGEMRIGYAASNGHPYRSIGRLLIDEGHIPSHRMSMQALQRYLREHPHDISRVLNHNPSLIFFRALDTPPVGSLGVPVTAERSIAVDQRIFPTGALAFLDTHEAVATQAGDIERGTPLRRLVLIQDTGGAIRGPRRVDFFWGRGEEAADRAGPMQQPGRLLVLVPRTEGAPAR